MNGYKGNKNCLYKNLYKCLYKLYSKKLILILLFLSISSNATAFDVRDEAIKLLDTMPAIFYKAATEWYPVIYSYSVRLYFSLGTIYFVWTIIIKVTQGEGLEVILAKLFKSITVFGIFLFLLKSGVSIAGLIIDSFREIAIEAMKTTGFASSYVEDNANISASTIIIKIINSFVTSAWYIISEIHSFSGILTGFFTLLILFASVVIIGLIGLNLIVEYIKAYIFLCLGSFVLAFGSTPWFRDTTIRYFKSAVAIGMRILIKLLIINMTFVIVLPIVESKLSLVSGFYFFFSVLLLYKLSISLPDRMATLISDTHDV